MVLRNGQLKLGEVSWRLGEDNRKGFSTVWTLILANISCISEKSRDIQEVFSFILHCKTMYCFQRTSPSTSTTSRTLTTCTPSSRADWFREEEASERTGNQCTSQPWTRCTPIEIWKKFNTIWTNPEPQCEKILGEFTKTQYIGAIWNSLKEKGLQFYQTRSHSIALSTLYLRYVLRRWYTWRLERICTAKYINPQGYRALYSRRICNLDVRILLTSMRENPPTIKANKIVQYRETCRSFLEDWRCKHLEENHRAKYKETCRGNLNSRCASLNSSGKTLESSKDWFNRSGITRTGTLQNRIWTRLRNSNCPAKSRGSWSPAWTTRNTSTSFARSLLEYNALRWPFFVDGVTCLVNSVSMCEEKREKEERRWERKWREIEVKRNERKDDFSKQMFQDPQTHQMNEPNMFRNRIPFGPIIPPFFFESLHDSNSIFGVRELSWLHGIWRWWMDSISDGSPGNHSRYSGNVSHVWVRAIQNRIRFVRHGNSSEDIDAQLSEVEDNGEKEHRSETSITKFRCQKR